MQKNTENDRWSGKLFWNEVAREGALMSPGAVMIKATLPWQLGLQISAADVSIRVRRNGTPAYGNGVIIRGRFEYKSPGDGLSIDTFYKIVGYACFYKGLGKTVDAIPIQEMSISFFREAYPEKLFKKLESLGMEIKNPYPGIYYIRQWQAMPDIQIVVTGAVDQEKHPALRVLSRNVKEEDARAFVQEASRLTEQGDRNNVDAVIDASVAANKGIYEKIRREDSFMGKALRELMKDEIESEIAEREQKADEKARQENSIELIRNLMETMKMTAEQAMEALKVPVKDRKKYMVGL